MDMGFTSRISRFMNVRNNYRLYVEKRRRQYLERAAERYTRVSARPNETFSDDGEGMNKLRFLRREHMYLDWSSWHSAIRDD